MSQPSLRRCQRRNTALAFALSLGLVAAAYALLGFVPFGDGTLLTGDLNGLYVNYITDLWRRVRQGGFFYSFSKLCGGSTLGLFAYYMNSPFNLLYLLFPVRAIPWVVQGVFALRTACTGAACCFYLQRHFGSASRLLPVLSLGYSLCAFCVVYNQNIIWMDVVLLAPLVLWAVDELTARGRHWPLTLLVCACTLLNFYTAWEVCLFSVLYFLYLWFSQPRVGGFWRRLGLFAASGTLGAALALGLLVPALLEVEQSKGGLFVSAGAEGNLLLIARDHVVHENAEARRRGLGVGDERSVGTDAGFGVVGTFHAHAGHGAGLVEVLAGDGVDLVVAVAVHGVGVPAVDSGTAAQARTLGSVHLNGVHSAVQEDSVGVHILGSKVAVAVIHASDEDVVVGGLH